MGPEQDNTSFIEREKSSKSIVGGREKEKGPNLKLRVDLDLGGS